MTTKPKSDTAAKLKRWRQPGAAGFFAFLDDVAPRIPSDKGGFQPYTIPSERVREEITRALDGGFSTVVLCWPRRHGKTVVAALVIVWRFLTRETENIAIVANSERQSVDTAFRLVRTVIEQTPYTKDLVRQGHVRVLTDRIEYPALQNVIQGFPNAPASLYGKRLPLAQVSELHAAKADDLFQVLASSTIDSEAGLVLVDSTVGPRSSPLYGLYNLAQSGEDPTLFYSHLWYRDLDDAIANGPAWIRPERLRSRAAQMLPAEFAAQHLNQWGSASNSVFPPDVIERCRESYPLNVEAIADGRAHAVGGGLDRALLFSLHGDKTVLATVVKVSGADDDEPHFYVLDAHAFTMATDGAVKRRVTAMQRDHGMNRIAIERYEAADLHQWCLAQGLEAELIHATPKQQVPAFTTLANAAREGRLHVHPKFAALFAEMETFEYTLRATGTGEGTVPRFEHAKGAHDDHLYALAWAVYSLRDIELNPYELPGIHCHAPGAIARLCLLNGGDLVPQCSDGCKSFLNVTALHGQYRAKVTVGPMELSDFFRTKVTNTGSHTLSR